MTTVYFRTLAASGQAQAMTVSLVVVAAVTVLCCGLVWLLPRAAHVNEPNAVDLDRELPGVSTD